MKRALILLISFTVMLLAATADASTVKLVIHSSNTTPSITKAKVADLFLKRVTRWDNGRVVTLVDVSDKSATRSAFSPIT